MLVDRLALHAAAFLQLLSSNIGTVSLSFNNVLLNNIRHLRRFSRKGLKTVHSTNIGNIAVHKPATQISTYSEKGFKAHAGLAVDGIVSNNFVEGSCSHTQGVQETGWWEVDLQDMYKIINVRILNRDVQVERLHDVRVDVYDSARHLRKGREGKHCNTHTGEAGPGWLNMICHSPVTGRYVTITKPQAYSDELTLCEVEIYEAPATFKTSHFRRMSLTQMPARGKKVPTSSNRHCGTVCVRTPECIGFSVTVGEDGNKQCHILSERPNKEDNSSGGTVSTYFYVE